MNPEPIQHDSGPDQDNLCTDFEDVDDSLPDERNYIHPSLSKNAKIDELNISQDPIKNLTSIKNKICNFTKNRLRDNV